MATFDQRQQVVSTQYNAVSDIYLYTQAGQVAALPLETIPDPAPLPPGSRMPLPRNPLFVGREADFRALAAALNDISGVSSQMMAVTGLGGLGKTQLASEFVHRYGQFFAGGVFWLNFADPTAVPTEVAACGGPGALALHPEFHTLPIADQVQLVQAAWQSPVPRLLVFDHCEDETLLAQWRPPHGGCRVLVTSRRAQWEATLGVQALPLGVLRREESLALLHHYRPDLSADDIDLDAIAAELGDLPLALHLAGSFLARYRQAITPAAYLAQLRQPNLLAHPSLQGLQLTRDLSPTHHEPHIARTFALSYDRLDPADPTDASALALLARAVHFAPGQPIPQNLLLATVARAQDAPEAAVQAKDALGRLLALGLLEPDATGAVRLHRILAVFVRAVAREAAAQTTVENVLLAEVDRLTRAGYPGPLLTLQPHLQAITEAAQLREDVRTARLNAALGSVLRLFGDYSGAEPYYARGLALSERELGPEHPDVAQSLHNLAGLYQGQGRYGEAAPLYQRALAIRERELGPEHPDVAQSLNNLALLYQAQGRYGEVEPLYQRALALRERALGPEHPDTATSLHNLAGLYYALGRYGEAEPLLQRALDIREHALGPTHPDVAQSLHNLAGLYQALGHYTKAEPLYQRALALLERGLGPEHPDVATSLHNLAGLYYALGRYGEAEPLLQRALVVYERTLGPEHPHVAQSLNNLALLYQDQGHYETAEPLLQRALALRERVLGPEHPDVATTLNTLAQFYQAQRRYDEAKPLYERALGIVERGLGPEHPDVATSLHNLAGLYYALGRYGEAEPLLQRALALRERALGPDHPDVAQSLHNLAVLYQALGRYGEAEPLLQRALALRERALGDNHPNSRASLIALAEVLQAQQAYAQAQSYYHRALAVTREAGDIPEEAEIQTHLGAIAAMLGEAGRATEHYEDALRLARPSLSQAKVAEILVALGTLARDQGQMDRAKILWLESRDLYRQLTNPLEESVARLLDELGAAHHGLFSFLEIARRYLSAAGFELQPGPEPALFLCYSQEPSWRQYFSQPIPTLVLSGAPLDLDAVLKLVRDAENLLGAHPQWIFVIYDHPPTDDAWLQIGAMRGKDVQVIPIDDTVLSAGQAKNLHRKELLDYLEDRFLSPRRDLYDRQHPISDRLNFFGREQLANRLMDELMRGNAQALFGLRKMGKSSLLNYLRDKLPCPAALVDLQAGVELSGIYDRILTDWGRSMRIKVPDLEWTPPRIARTRDPSGGFTAAVRALLDLLDGRGPAAHLVVLVDEIELIAPQGRRGLQRYLAFARALRGIAQERLGRFALVIAGVDPAIVRANRLAGQQNPFYNFFREEYLPPLNPEDCGQMIRNIGVQMGLKYTDEAVAFVAELSGGHPYWARKLCSLAFQSWEGTGEITLDHLRNTAQRFIQEPGTAQLLDEHGLWGEITDPYLWPKPQIAANEDVLLSLAEAERRAKRDLIGKAAQRSAYNTALFELNQRSILGQPETDIFWIHLRLFRNWIRSGKLGTE